MVSMKKGLGGNFGGATGANRLEATGAVVEASFLGKMAMTRPEVQAAAKANPANTVTKKR